LGRRKKKARGAEGRFAVNDKRRIGGGREEAKYIRHQRAS